MKASSQYEKAPKGRALIAKEDGRLVALQSDATVSSPSAGTPENRLDSWKEIASYLGREVRTVQRWEKRERLPVHRHFHRKIGSIYAFKTEIEEWRKERSSSPGGKDSLGAELSSVRNEVLLPAQFKNQLAIPRQGNHSTPHGKNENFVQAIIFVTPALQALPKELQALRLGKLLTIGGSVRGRRTAGFVAVSVANAG